MAAAVLPSLQSLSLGSEIMPPSPISQNTSRHGRSRHGGSVAKSKGRGRGYSVVDERDVLISKALSWVLKRAIEESEEKEGGDRVTADKEGWVNCEETLRRPNLEVLQATFSEIQALVASPTSRSRFTIKLASSADVDSASASDFLIRLNPIQPTPAPTAYSATTLTPLTISTADLPELIVYETSYANYPLILASGGIKRAGGQAHLNFTTIQVQEDGTIRPSTDADVSIFVSLRTIMESDSAITWFRTENGNVVTEGDATGSIQKKFWKKALARRADIGILFEDGEAKKEVPVGLRGKGVKGKKGSGKGKGRGLKEMKARSEDEGTSSD